MLSLSVRPGLAMSLTLACAFTAAGHAAHAQEAGEAGPESEWTFVAGIATDNRSKGVSKSEGDPYGWVEAEWENAGGTVYFASSFEVDSHRSELEASVGARRSVAEFELEIELTHKWKFESGFDEVESEWEVTGSVEREAGPLGLRLLAQYSPGGDEPDGAWSWVEGRAAWRFSDILEGSAALGWRDQDTEVDYTAWNAGVAIAATSRINVDLRYYDTDASGAGERYESRFVAALSLSF